MVTHVYTSRAKIESFSFKKLLGFTRSFVRPAKLECRSHESTVFMPYGMKNQNQRYSCLMAFTGYEVRMDFRINGMKPVWASPGVEYATKLRLPGWVDKKGRKILTSIK